MGRWIWLLVSLVAVGFAIRGFLSTPESDSKVVEPVKKGRPHKRTKVTAQPKKPHSNLPSGSPLSSGMGKTKAKTKTETRAKTPSLAPKRLGRERRMNPNVGKSQDGITPPVPGGGLELGEPFPDYQSPPSEFDDLPPNQQPPEFDGDVEAVPFEETFEPPPPIEPPEYEPLDEEEY